MYCYRISIWGHNRIFVWQLVKERLLGQAIIGKQSGKEKIMSVDVICKFIAPLLDLSTKKLHFYVEKVTLCLLSLLSLLFNHHVTHLPVIPLYLFQQPNDELKEKYESVTLKNISSLPLTIFVSVKQPFSIGFGDTPHTGKLQVE